MANRFRRVDRDIGMALSRARDELRNRFADVIPDPQKMKMNENLARATRDEKVDRGVEVRCGEFHVSVSNNPGRARLRNFRGQFGERRVRFGASRPVIDDQQSAAGAIRFNGLIHLDFHPLPVNGPNSEVAARANAAGEPQFGIDPISLFDHSFSRRFVGEVGRALDDFESTTCARAILATRTRDRKTHFAGRLKERHFARLDFDRPIRGQKTNLTSHAA